MENGKIKSKFQIGKNYIKEFNINILDDNFPKDKKYSFDLQVGISDINTDDKYKYANVFLSYNIILKDKEKEFLKIYIKSVGEFRTPKKIDKDKFIEYCKYNGTPMISQNVRTYLKAVTALSDIEPINLPMINFYEVFSDENKQDFQK